MRLGILLEDVSPKAGGAFTVLDYLIQELVSTSVFSQFEVYVISSKNMKKRFASTNINFITFPTLRLLGHWLFFQLKSIILKRELSVINLHEFSLNYHLLRLKVNLLWSPTPMRYSLFVPYINTVWDLGHLDLPFLPEFSTLEDDEFSFREKKMSLIIRRAAANVVGTSFLKQRIVKNYNLSEKRVFVTGLPCRRLPVRMPVEKTPRTFLYPAQFWAHKNHVTLLKAVAILRDEHSVVISLRLVGSDRGSLNTVQHWIEKLGLCEFVSISEFIPEQELVSVYQESFALIFPSLLGPENLPPFEGLVSGCEVLVADVGGAREVYGQNVRYFDPLDPTDIAEVMIEAINVQTEKYSSIPANSSLATFLTARDYLSNIQAIIQGLRSELDLSLVNQKR